MSNLRTHHRHRSARRSAVSVAAVSIVAIAAHPAGMRVGRGAVDAVINGAPRGAGRRCCRPRSGAAPICRGSGTSRCASVNGRPPDSSRSVPVERGWAGSLTPDSTNTLAIRVLTVDGDSVRMIVASREGDVRFQGRLTNDARTMEGIVEYHGGALLPMTATRRARRVVPH
jgi:hypothetical protein